MPQHRRCIKRLIRNVDLQNDYIFDYEKHIDRIGNEAVFGVWWNFTAVSTKCIQTDQVD